MVETDSYKTETKSNTIIYNLLNVGTCTLKESAILDTTDTDTYTEFGGATDTWSCTALTEANLESSSFGVSVEGDKDGGANPADGSYHLDHLRVTVYYTEAGEAGQVIIIARRDK
jgi:hypothetical protein